MNANLLLSTARLTLRLLREDDAEALFAIYSDPVVMRYWASPPWKSIEEARDLIARDQLPGREYLRLGLERREDGRLIGQCSLFNLNQQCQRAELGYSLAQSAWGGGYAQEAVSAVLTHAFGKLNLNRVEADIDPRNTASAKLLERLGFTREGLLRERWIVDGEASDTAWYGLLARNWFGNVDKSDQT